MHSRLKDSWPSFGLCGVDANYNTWNSKFRNTIYGDVLTIDYNLQIHNE
jgi:hypothetical protein